MTRRTVRDLKGGEEGGAGVIEQSEKTPSLWMVVIRTDVI